MVFIWILSDSKSPQVSRTLLSILAVLNNVVVWIVSTRPPIFKSSRPFNNSMVTVPKAPITIGIIVTFMFHSFCNSLARSRYLSFSSLSFSFILWSVGTAKSTILRVLFFFFCWLLLGPVFWPRLGDPFLSKSYRSLCVIFSDRCWFVHIPFVHMVTFQLLAHIPPSYVLCYTPSVLICCISLLCDWWFRFYHHIIYICYFIASYLFSLWYDWFLWHFLCCY